MQHGDNMVALPAVGLKVHSSKSWNVFRQILNCTPKELKAKHLTQHMILKNSDMCLNVNFLNLWCFHSRSLLSCVFLQELKSSLRCLNAQYCNNKRLS